MSPSTSKLFSFLFTLSLFLISSHSAPHPPQHAPAPAPHPPPQKLYEIVCNSDSYCMKVIGSDPHIVAAKDWVTISRLILQMAIKHGVKAQNYIKGLSKYPLSDAIRRCADVDYGYSIRSFESAMGELIEDPMTATYDAKVAGDGPLSCRDRLKEEKLNIPAVDRLNWESKFFSNVAFDATCFIPEPETI